ncbi:YoaK family protein [Undibacterium rugosum]|uniref:YoaK family protein n=1 Tax=Undibacterium rugosum TaxID=2762291 RepID=UPI001B835746|nr:YoaK family protein [Undibacterium rugosum]MBR7780295.1 DUF1275 domain-containing protein [Undibacterium rugosum]
MPLHYLSTLTSPKRTAKTNLHLGIALAAIAGAINAGGFLAVGKYTSHMTGMLSEAADDFVLGRWMSALAALFMLLSFAAGAASTALMVHFARDRQLRYIYTPVLLLEAALLLVFGLTGTELQTHALVTVSLTTVLLCYLMGLQNALITKISNAEIRTTHVTGLVTDLGIELGKLLYWRRARKQLPDQELAGVNIEKLRLCSMLVAAFFGGALLGAAGFKHLGFVATVPIALGLITLALAPNLKPRSQK